MAKMTIEAVDQDIQVNIIREDKTPSGDDRRVEVSTKIEAGKTRTLEYVTGDKIIAR